MLAMGWGPKSVWIKKLCVKKLWLQKLWIKKHWTVDTYTISVRDVVTGMEGKAVIFSERASERNRELRS